MVAPSSTRPVDGGGSPSDRGAPREAASGASSPSWAEPLWGHLAGLSRQSWFGLAVVLVVGLVVFLPAVRSQLLLDDYLHASMIDGTYPVHRGPLDLYDFVEPSERATLVERGMLPWWSHPELKIRFLRPLSSVLRWAEQSALGRGSLAPHVHSLLWWVAAVLSARGLYRRLLPERAALLATAVFALAPCHALPIAWLANREALVSLTFGALALSAYHRWLQQGRARDALAATALFALALAGGEYALCLGGYVLTLAVFAPFAAPASQATPGVEPGPGGGGRGPGAVARLAGLGTYGLPAAGYLGLRAALGYGTHGSSFYNDPLHEPVAFLFTAPRRLAALVTQEWFTVDSDDAAWVLTTLSLAAAVLALAIVPVRTTFAALAPEVRARARALLVGSHLALLPVLAVDPSPRVLGAALLGLAPIFALVMDHAWFPATTTATGDRRGAAELTGLVALGIGFFQLIHGPVTAFMIGEHYRRTSVDFVADVADLAGRIPDPAHDELLVLRGGPSSFFVPFALAGHGKMPSRWRVLSTTGHALGLRRDARAIELVVPKDQSMLTWFSWDLFRDTGTTFTEGQVVQTPGLTATILEVGRGGPRRVRFDLDADLDDPAHVWITESVKGDFPAATLPRLGFGQPYEP